MKNINIKVLNVLGENIYEKENINHQCQFEINTSVGLYVIELSSGENIKNYKLIKQ